MRIISGTAKGTKLYTLDGINTRPTLDRVKEPLFSILNFRLEDSVVLDLFAGSGALGLEALSRGARKAIFCEKYLNAAKVIQKNIEKTKYEEKSLLIRNDFEKALKQIESNNLKIDIVFLDPPYKTDYAYRAIDIIIKDNLLNKDGIIIVETDEITRIQNELSNLNIEAYDVRKYGRVYLLFIKLEKEDLLWERNGKDGDIQSFRINWRDTRK